MIFPSAGVLLAQTLFAQLVFAQNSKIANCDVAERDIAAAKNTQDDSIRMAGLERVYQEIETLEKLRVSNKEYPRQFIAQCLKAKGKIFQLHKDLVSNATKGTPLYNMVVGKTFELEAMPDTAATYYERAIQGDPRSPEAHWAAYSLYMNQELKKAKAAHKNLGVSETASVLEKSNRHIDAIVKSPASTPEQKTKAISFRARFFDSLARPTEAFTDWKTVLTLDRNNLEALGRVAAFQIQNQDPAAKETLTKLKALVPTNELVHTQLAEISLNVPTDALQLAKGGQKLFPTNPQFLIVEAKAYLALDQRTEAENSARRAVSLSEGTKHLAAAKGILSEILRRKKTKP